MGLFDNVLNKKNKSAPILQTEKNTIYAPVSGKFIELVDFPDEAFSDGILGQGCGIQPTEEIIKAPFNGEVIQLQDSQHALGLQSEDGMELLIHIGVDTVSMNGKGFRSLVKKGERVVMGQDLIEFKMAEIKKAGLNSAVAVIVTNSDDYNSVKVIPSDDVSVNAPIIIVESVN
jgi:glucose-specific phosphotransferase system IIA component